MKFERKKKIMSGLLRVVGALPLGVHYFNAVVLAFIIEKVVRYRTDIVYRNIAESFPEKSGKEVKRICHEFYRHFANVFVEAIWFGACRNPERLKKAGIVKVINPETINSLFDSSPSVMVMYSHTGNWELMGGIENYFEGHTCITEQNFCVVYKQLTSRLWDELMKDNRSAPLKDREHFQGYQETGAFLRYALKHKNDRMIYSINTDQRPYNSSSANISVNFLGRECQSMTGAAAIARKLSMCVLYQRMMKTGQGHYTIEYVPICDNAATMSAEDIMSQYYKLLEDDIRKQPCNYLWSHRRWI